CSPEQDPQERQDRVLHRGESRSAIGEEEHISGPGRSRDEGGSNDRGELIAEGIIAEHLRTCLVLTNGGKHPAERGAHNREARKHRDRQEKKGEIITRGGVAQMNLAAEERDLPHIAREREALVA